MMESKIKQYIREWIDESKEHTVSLFGGQVCTNYDREVAMGLAMMAEKRKDVFGFICNDGDAEYIDVAFRNSLFGYMKSDGTSVKPYICLINDEGKQEGVILSLDGRGLKISGEYTTRSEPDLDTITQDCWMLVHDWLHKIKEEWIIDG